jgi:hypothetical protein
MSEHIYDTCPNPGDNEAPFDNLQLKLEPVFPFKHPSILRVKGKVTCSGMTQANKRCKKQVAGSSVSYCHLHKSIYYRTKPAWVPPKGEELTMTREGALQEMLSLGEDPDKWSLDKYPYAKEPLPEEPLRRCGYCFATEGTDVTSGLVSVFFSVGREVLLCTKHLDLIRADDIYTVKEAVLNV